MPKKMSPTRHSVYVERRKADRARTMTRKRARASAQIVKGRA